MSYIGRNMNLTCRNGCTIGTPKTSCDVHGIESKPIDQKRVEIQRNRIGACDTLIDHILDDIPHRDQQPILDLLVRFKTDLEDEMEDAFTQ